MTQPVDDNYDWTRLSGRTASSNTGPEQDKTTGNGFYIYAEVGTFFHLYIFHVFFFRPHFPSIWVTKLE